MEGDAVVVVEGGIYGGDPPTRQTVSKWKRSQRSWSSLVQTGFPHLLYVPLRFIEV